MKPVTSNVCGYCEYSRPTCPRGVVVCTDCRAFKLATGKSFVGGNNPARCVKFFDTCKFFELKYDLTPTK